MFKPKFDPGSRYLTDDFQPFGRPYTGAICILKNKTRVMNNGSCGLVDTGRKRLLITCHHIWEDFQNKCSKGRGVTLHICGKSALFELSAPPIAWDKHIDLVTFEAPPALFAQPDFKFFSFDCFNFPKIERGDPIAFIGFPGSVKKHTLIGARFKREAAATFVDDVSDRTIVSSLSRMSANWKVSGYSGGACYLISKYKPPQMISIVTESGLGLLKYALLNCLKPDGTITPRTFV
jgi:hypothetical protein